MISKDFLLAGNAIFTVKVNETHFTYQIKLPYMEKGRRLTEAERRTKPYFVGKLTGPDNTSNYTYLGILNPTNLTVELRGRTRYTKSSEAVKVLEFALDAIVIGDSTVLPKGWEILPPTRCGRCGRLLTVPESIELGIGPECFGKMGGTFAQALGLDFNALVKEAIGGK